LQFPDSVRIKTDKNIKMPHPGKKLEELPYVDVSLVLNIIDQGPYCIKQQQRYSKGDQFAFSSNMQYCTSGIMHITREFANILQIQHIG
jgi:hypothetical protein